MVSETDTINREIAMRHAQADADSAWLSEGRQRSRALIAERGLREAQKALDRLREPCADRQSCCERCARVEELGR